ncbi:MAG: phosphate acyltransferase PlsX [Gemmatimonadetes bacterium]|nr:phosphate acyltransferase PlsX [Gemmatimonadota bacterium]MDE2676765.1 phosphate acyltransferase PlsX [Gemmatimonadota bacterium]MXX33671.1 phosphate acyltransferase PlsX [Gemmatimonadota bacterium]MYA11892.1 phosphate acyltransferase PlsX [Gemmatimonadota bacterium]MYD12065.1 phosphate acyltransferase PlsX [Gemmatimonadota bacterium]
MRIALDAMGTDHAPDSEVAGAMAAVRQDPDLNILLVGDETQIAGRMRHFPGQDRITVVHTPDRIAPDESPISALRRTPRSSINLGLDLQKAGEADAFVSAGSTGAVMAASQLRLRALEGVDRPTLGTPFPTSRGTTLVVDSGANVDCKPQQLFQFARLGAIYMHDVAGIDNPAVGLLNVGSEPLKGPEAVQAAHRLLAESDLNFVGNVEGRDIIQHSCDVLVCDGFIGNILLKFYESTASFMAEAVRTRLEEDCLDPGLDELFRGFDYAEYGGVPLLGVNGVTIVCHGASSSKAIKEAVGVAKRAVDSGMVSHMARDLAAGQVGNG